jgi:hypothetical protein
MSAVGRELGNGYLADHLVLVGAVHPEHPRDLVESCAEIGDAGGVTGDDPDFEPIPARSGYGANSAQSLDVRPLNDGLAADPTLRGRCEARGEQSSERRRSRSRKLCAKLLAAIVGRIIEVF